MVPQVVIDEYERIERIETSMTSSVAQRFKAIKQDLDDYGADADAAKVVDDLARHTPLIGAMTTRNFDDVLALLKGGRRLEPTEAEQLKVVARGLAKQAPFHRSRNSVADALLVELYSTAASGASKDDPYAFVTTNSEDFSSPTGDKRDYISVGRYWWPDSDKPDGLPYIRRDGQTNPEALKNDFMKMSRMMSAVRGLAPLYYFTGDEEAAAHAAGMLKTFFTDPETGMKPHLTYAQAVPGREEGRPLGIIDTYAMIELADCIALLENARDGAEDCRRLRHGSGIPGLARSERMASAFSKIRITSMRLITRRSPRMPFLRGSGCARRHLAILQEAIQDSSMRAGSCRRKSSAPGPGIIPFTP